MTSRNLNMLWTEMIFLAVLLLSATTKADLPVYTDASNFKQLTNHHNGFPRQEYRSSEILGPVFQVGAWNLTGADDSRFIFIGSVYGEGKAGPMILDARDLSLVHADQQYANTYHSDVQYINGQPYYMFWQGAHGRGHANGHCLFIDETYNLVYNVTAQGRPGVLADMHDLRVTHDGNAIFTTYFNVPWDTSALGGEQESLIMDSGFQEVNIETNEIVFDWAASDHFNIADSKAPYGEGYGIGPESGYDFAHVNSVEKTHDGDYLVSMRHLSVVALVSGQYGHLLWTLGGKLNQFTDLSDGKATDFSWQHDARFYLGNTSQITMFDNHGEQTNLCHADKAPLCMSRGLHLELNYEAVTAKVLKEYYHPGGLNSGAMGSLTTLKNGNTMIAWGYHPSYTEHTSDGEIVSSFDRGERRHLPDMFAYRVTKGEWVGKPTWPPSIAMDIATESTGNTTVYLSWNGATEVDSWAIYTSTYPHGSVKSGEMIAKSHRKGFETIVSFEPPSNKRRQYVTAAALDSRGNILGTTDTLDMRDGSIAELGDVPVLVARLPIDDNTWLERTAVLFFLVIMIYCAVFSWKRQKMVIDLEWGLYRPRKRAPGGSRSLQTII